MELELDKREERRCKCHGVGKVGEEEKERQRGREDQTPQVDGEQRKSVCREWNEH